MEVAVIRASGIAPDAMPTCASGVLQPVKSIKCEHARGGRIDKPLK